MNYYKQPRTYVNKVMKAIKEAEDNDLLISPWSYGVTPNENKNKIESNHSYVCAVGSLALLYEGGLSNRFEHPCYYAAKVLGVDQDFVDGISSGFFPHPLQSYLDSEKSDFTELDARSKGIVVGLKVARKLSKMKCHLYPLADNI